MDPNAALNALIDACEDTDHEAIREYADALHVWLSKGGFAPSNDRLASLFAWMRDAAHDNG